ncbi:MAG: glycosyltransferase family 2 protein, partial [Lachnospiraceae bacterium]|nr:glycosyltransferase family 2 protein [Lachnospiraceae bacterium]
SDIVTPLVARLYEIPDVGSVSPLLYKPDGEIDYCCARRSLEKKDMLVTFSYLFNKQYTAALEKRKILRESPELINQEKIEIDLPSGSCMLFKKSVFEALGGFDKGTFLYYEEDILNKKIKQMGLKNVLIPSVNCIYVGGATTNNTKSAFFLKKCNYESLLYYLQKYESCTRLELCYFKLSASLRLGRLYLGRLYHKYI